MVRVEHNTGKFVCTVYELFCHVSMFFYFFVFT